MQIRGGDRLDGGVFGDADDFSVLDEVLWEPISAATLVRSRPQFDELVLDACCGAGASALPTAELVGIGGLVDAIDTSEPLVELARDRAGSRLPQLHLSVADATTWETVGYDLVQCVLGVFLFDDLDEGVRHLVEAAKPGGRVAVTVWARGAFDPIPAALAEALRGDTDVPDTDAFAHLVMSEAETPGSLALWLSGHGLVQVRADAVHRHLELDDDLAWALVLGTRLRTFVAGLDAEALDQVRERFVESLRTREVTSIDVTTLIGVGHRPA
ncbi:class I SAM-dependent methyltransferase [Agromyces sp. MMS24-K17]|uniref:class I SAM-dependent methyltransferase n=1 Tax=Agromyces sp. MMS24-K17 TaxID=3372850 RepID=UPI003754933F